MSVFFDKKVAMDKVVQVLEERGIKQKEVSDATGVSGQNLVNWKSRGIPNIDRLKQLAEFLKLPVEYFFGTEEPKKVPVMKGWATRSCLEDAPQDEEYELVPKINILASAGNGSFISSEYILDYYKFKKSWLRSLHLRKEAIALITVDGDSMFPTLKHKETVLVDTNDKTIPNPSLRNETTGLCDRDNNIFLFMHNNERYIKRLEKTCEGGIIKRSDNWVDYAPVAIDAEEMESFQIIGRVVWHAGTMD